MPQLTVYPYLYEQTCWVFDDKRTGLKEEAFVLGMTEMISRLVKAKSLPRDRRSSLIAIRFIGRPLEQL